MAKIEPSVRLLAAEIMARTIHGHYVHGIVAGERLNFGIIAGESVEAALELERALDAEESKGTISRAMLLNRAFRAGYAAGFNGQDITIFTEGGLDDEELNEAGHNGWSAGAAAAAGKH